MERYNLRSGFHVTPTVQDCGRTERDHLTGLAARDVAVLTGEENLTESREISPFSESPKRERPARPKKSVSWLNRPESGAKLSCVISSLQHLQKHCPGTVSTIPGESLETRNENGQPPVLHQFDVTPPVEAAYATQDVSAITPERSQIVSQSAPSFQPSPKSRTPTTNTQSQQYFTSINVVLI